MKTRITLYILAGLAAIGYLLATDNSRVDVDPGSVSGASLEAVFWIFGAWALFWFFAAAYWVFFILMVSSERWKKNLSHGP